MVTCTMKFRDRSNKIVGYRLMGDGRVQDFEAGELKRAIASGNIRVDNLKLTSDGRLVDCNPFGKPDEMNMVKIQSYRDGRLRSTEFVEGSLDDAKVHAEVQRRVNSFNPKNEQKVTQVKQSTIKPVKEVKVDRMNKDGSYIPSGIRGALNLLNRRNK